MFSDPIWWIALLSGILALGFLGGLMVNRRLGRQLYRTLRQALEAYGTVAQARWLGGATSGVYLSLHEARPPLRRLEAVVLLEPREFLPVWLVARWVRGQRDALILRVVFRRTPHTEWEWRTQGRLGLRGFSPPGPDEGFESVTAPGFRGWVRPRQEPEAVTSWHEFLGKYGGRLLALSLRKRKPHLILAVKVRGLDVATFLEDLLVAVEPWL